MRFHIIPTRQFLKTAKKYRFSGRKHILKNIEAVTQLLSAQDADSLSALRAHWRDHALVGDKRGLRELHLDHEDLLLYSINESSQSVELVDIVTHEELR